mgnify:CR=1 FL=1
MWWLSLALAGPCADADLLTPVDLRDELEALWSTSDDRAFRTGMAAVDGQLSCIAEPVEPLDVARLHRNQAQLALASGDERGARRALASMARVADGTDTPEVDDGWLAARSELGALDAVGAEPAMVEFRTSLAVTVLVDGKGTNQRPVDQPVFLQAFAPDGSLVDAAWVSARDPLPTWVALPPNRCERTEGTGALAASSRAAEEAFARLDVVGFRAALEQVATGLPCADAVVSPAEAAAIHRLEGVRLYTIGAQDSALRSLQQARLLDPLGTVEGDAMAEGSPLARLWDKAGDSPAPPWVPIDAPDGLSVRVDGIPSRSRPLTVPSIVQLTTKTGRVLWSSYVPAMAELPPLEVFAPDAERIDLAPARALYLEDEVRRKRTGQQRVLVLSGSAMLLASGLLWQTNRNAVSDYYAPETSPEYLERHRVRANVAGGGSVATGSVGAVLLGVAIALEL